MKKILASLFLALAATPALATFPQDDYHNYLIVLVHGLGGDTNIIGNTAYPKHVGWLKPSDYFNKPEYLSVIKQPGTNTEDFADGLFEFLTDSIGIDSANVRYYEMSRACNGFYNETPGMATTSRELGDRNYDNPGANRWPRDKSTSIRLRFGLEKGSDGKGLSWLQQALSDWEKTWRNRNPDFPNNQPIPDSLVPKKYILIGHSMGGLTIRSYLASDFYQNDVEKVVTIASPASGSEALTYIHQAELHGDRFLQNDWNQQFIAKTILEGTALYFANQVGTLDNSNEAMDKIMNNAEAQNWTNQHLGTNYNLVNESDFRTISPFSFLSGFGTPKREDAVGVFIFEKMLTLGAKTVLDDIMEHDNTFFGHVWDNELGVQQLEPLATNPTKAISSLNEFRFPDIAKHLPKFRASGIEDVPSPSMQTPMEKFGVAVEEAVKIMSLFFPSYTNSLLGTISGNGAVWAVQHGSDPWSFATTQSVLNNLTSQIGFHLDQAGDFAVPAYSSQCWKTKDRSDQIELMKQADFQYQRIPYDQVGPLGEIYEATSLASMGWNKLAELGLLGGPWVHFFGLVGIDGTGGILCYSYTDRLKRWLGAHGHAMGYVADRKSPRANNYGQSIIENQLWDAPSVSITAVRKTDSLTGAGMDMIPDTTIWAPRFSVGNRLGAWKEGVFSQFLTFRRKDAAGNRDYAFMPAIDLTTNADTIHFVVEDFQVESLRSVLVSVNYGPWRNVTLGASRPTGPFPSMTLNHWGNPGAFYMTGSELDLKEGENDLRIMTISRHGRSAEQSANIRLFTTAPTVQPHWPLDNVGIVGGHTPIDFDVRFIFDQMTGGMTLHAAVLGRDSTGNLDSLVLPQSLFAKDFLPGNGGSLPGGFRIHTLSNVDFSRFVRRGSTNDVLVRLTVTPTGTGTGAPMPTFSLNLHVVLEDQKPVVRWLHDKKTLKVSRAWIDSARFISSFSSPASQLQDIRVVAISPSGATHGVDSAPAVATGAKRETRWDLLWNGTPVEGTYKLVVQARSPAFRNPSDYAAWIAYVDSSKPLSASYDIHQMNWAADTLWLDIRNTAPSIASVQVTQPQPKFNGSADQAQVRVPVLVTPASFGVATQYRFVRQVGVGGAGPDTVEWSGKTDSTGHDTLTLAWEGTQAKIPDGVWSLQVRGSDDWGNVGAWRSWTGSVRVDHTAPTLVVTGPGVHVANTQTVLQMDLSASEPLDRPEFQDLTALAVQVSLLDGAGNAVRSATLTKTISNGQVLVHATLPLSGLGAGAYSIRSSVADASGNTVTDSRDVVMDHLPTQIDVPTQGQAVDGPFELRGSADDPTNNDSPFQSYSVDCSINAGVTWNGTCASVPDGTANVGLRTVDRGLLAWIVPPSGATSLQVRLRSTDGHDTATVIRAVQWTTGTPPVPFLVLADTLHLVAAGGDSLVRPVSIPWGMQFLPDSGLWEAQLEFRDSAQTVRHREHLEGIRFSSLFGAPSVQPDSTGIYLFHEQGSVYRLRVVTGSTNDSVRIRLMGQGGVRAATGAWKTGASYDGVAASVDDGQNFFTFQADGKRGTWDVRLEFLGSQGFFLGEKIVLHGRKPWHAILDSAFAPLDSAPVFAGVACKPWRNGSWDIGNAPSAWAFDARPLVGPGVIPDGHYVARLRVSSQTDGTSWGQVEKSVVLRSTNPVVRNLSVDPASFFPYAPLGNPAPRSATWKLGLSRLARLTATVVNSTGQVVRLLVQDSLFPAGVSTLSWNGATDLSGLSDPGTYRMRVQAVPIRVGEIPDAAAAMDTTGAPVLLGQAGWTRTTDTSLSLRLPGAQNQGSQGWLVDAGTWNREVHAMLGGEYFERVPFQAHLKFSGRQEVPYYPFERYTLRINRHFDRIAYDVVNVTRLQVNRDRQRRYLGFTRCSRSQTYRLAAFDTTVYHLEDAESDNAPVPQGSGTVSRPKQVSFTTPELHVASSGDDGILFGAKIKFYIRGIDNYALVFPKGELTNAVIGKIASLVASNASNVDNSKWSSLSGLLFDAGKAIEIVEGSVGTWEADSRTPYQQSLKALANNVDSASMGGQNLTSQDLVQQGNFISSADWATSQGSSPQKWWFFGSCGQGIFTAKIKLSLQLRPELWNPPYGRNSLVNRYVTFDPNNTWLMQQLALALDGFDNDGDPNTDDLAGYVAPGYRYRLSLPHITGTKPNNGGTFPLFLWYRGDARVDAAGNWNCDSSLCSRDESYRVDVLDPRPDDQVYNTSGWDLQAKSCVGGQCSSTQIPPTDHGASAFAWKLAKIGAKPDSLIVDVGITRPTRPVQGQYGLVDAPWPMSSGWLDSVSRGWLTPTVGQGVSMRFDWKRGGIVQRGLGIAILDSTPALTPDTVLAHGVIWRDTLHHDATLPDTLHAYGSRLQVEWPSLAGGIVTVGKDTLRTPALSFGYQVQVDSLPDTIGVARNPSSDQNLVDLVFFRKRKDGTTWNPTWDSRMDPVLQTPTDRDGDSLNLEESDPSYLATDPVVFRTDLDGDSLRGEDVRGALRQTRSFDIRSDLSAGTFKLSDLYPSDSLVAWVARHPGILSIPTAWRLDAQKHLVANPDVILERAQAQITHLDGRMQSDVDLQEQSDLVLGHDADKVYALKLAPMSQAPSRRMVIEGRVPAGEYMLYAVDPVTGNVTTIAHRPDSLSAQGRNGMLGTLDITRVNGALSVVLAHKGSDGNWTFDSKQVRIGTFVSSSSSTDAVVEGGMGRIQVLIQAGALGKDTVVNVTPLPRSAVAIGSGSVAVEPRGYVIEIQPSPLTLLNGKKAIITARFSKAEMIAENGSLTDLSLWYLASDGTIKELENTTVTQTGDVVVVQGATSHFSKFVVLTKSKTYAGLLKAGDSTGFVPSLTRDTIRQIPVHAVPGAVVGVWEMVNGVPVRLGGVHCNGNGDGQVTVKLSVGTHQLVVKVDSLCSGSVCSPVTNSPSVLDSVQVLPQGPGALSGLKVDPLVFSPDGDGIQDSVFVSANSSLPGTALLDVVGPDGQVVAQRHGTVSQGIASCVWDGKDAAGAVALGAWRVRLRLVDGTGWTTNELEGSVVSDTGRSLLYEDALSDSLPYGVGQDRDFGADTSHYYADGSGWDGETDTSVFFSGRRSLVIRHAGDDPVAASEGWTPSNVRIPDSSSLIFAWRKSDSAARLSFLLSTSDGGMYEVAEQHTWFGKGLELPTLDTGWHQVVTGVAPLGRWGLMGRYDTVPSGRVARVEFGVRPHGTNAKAWADLAAFAPYGVNPYLRPGKWNPVSIDGKSSQIATFTGAGLSLDHVQFGTSGSSLWRRDTVQPLGRGWVLEADTAGDWNGTTLQAAVSSQSGIRILSWPVALAGASSFPASIQTAHGIAVSFGSPDSASDGVDTLRNLRLSLGRTGNPAADSIWRHTSLPAWRLIRDTTSPRISVTGVSDGLSTRQDLTPTVLVQDDHLWRTSLKLDNQAWVSGTTVSQEGEHLLVAHATDLGGNDSLLSIHFRIDRTPPTISLNSPTEGASISTVVRVAGIVDDPTVTQVRIHSGVKDTMVSIVDGAFRTLLELPLGSQVIEVHATDAAGNEGVLIRNVRVNRVTDGTPPVLHLVSPVPGTVQSPVSVQGQAIDSHLAMILVDGSLVPFDAQGRFSVSLALPSGGKHLKVLARDSSGNSDSVEMDLAVRDTVAPSILGLHLDRQPDGGTVASFTTDKLAGVTALVQSAGFYWTTVASSSGTAFTMPLGAYPTGSHPQVRFILTSESGVARIYGVWPLPEGYRRIEVKPSEDPVNGLAGALDAAAPNDTLELAPGIHHVGDAWVPAGVVVRGAITTECVVAGSLHLGDKSRLERFTLVNENGSKTGLRIDSGAAVSLESVIVRGFVTGVEARGQNTVLHAKRVTSIHSGFGFRLRLGAQGEFDHCLAWSQDKAGTSRIGFQVDRGATAHFDGCRGTGDSLESSVAYTPLFRNNLPNYMWGIWPFHSESMQFDTTAFDLSGTLGSKSLGVHLAHLTTGNDGWAFGGQPDFNSSADAYQKFGALRFLINRFAGDTSTRTPHVRIWLQDEGTGNSDYVRTTLDSALPEGLDADPTTWQEVVIPFEKLGLSPLNAFGNLVLKLMDDDPGSPGQPPFALDEITLVPRRVAAAVTVGDPSPVPLLASGEFGTGWSVAPTESGTAWNFFDIAGVEPPALGPVSAVSHPIAGLRLSRAPQAGGTQMRYLRVELALPDETEPLPSQGLRIWAGNRSALATDPVIDRLSGRFLNQPSARPQVVSYLVPLSGSSDTINVQSIPIQAGQDSVRILSMSLVDTGNPLVVVPVGVTGGQILPVGQPLTGELSPRIALSTSGDTVVAKIASGSASLIAIDSLGQAYPVLSTGESGGWSTSSLLVPGPARLKVVEGGDTVRLSPSGLQARPGTIDSVLWRIAGTNWSSGCFQENGGTQPIGAGACDWGREVQLGGAIDEEISRIVDSQGVLFLGAGTYQVLSAMNQPSTVGLVGSGWRRTNLDVLGRLTLRDRASISSVRILSHGNTGIPLIRSENGLMAWTRVDAAQSDSVWRGTGRLSRILATGGYWQLDTGTVAWSSGVSSAWKLGVGTATGLLLQSSSLDALPTRVDRSALPVGILSVLDAGRADPVWQDPSWLTQDSLSPYREGGSWEPDGRPELGCQVFSSLHHGSTRAWFTGEGALQSVGPVWNAKIRVTDPVLGRVVVLQVDGLAPIRTTMTNLADTLLVLPIILDPGTHSVRVWISGHTEDADIRTVVATLFDRALSGNDNGVWIAPVLSRETLVPGEMLPFRAWADTGTGPVDITALASWEIMEGAGTISLGDGFAVLKAPSAPWTWLSLRAVWKGSPSIALRYQVAPAADLEAPRLIGIVRPLPGQGFASLLVPISLRAWDANGITARLVNGDSSVPLAVRSGAPTGEFILDTVLSFQEGLHSPYLILRDTLGNQRRVDLKFRCDTTPPALTMIDAPLDGVAWMATKTLTGQVDDPASTVVCSTVAGNAALDSVRVVPDAHGYFSCTVSFPAGISHLKVSATDSLGNTSRFGIDVVRDVSSDHSAPLITFSRSWTGQGVASNQIQIDGTVEEASGIRSFTVDGVETPLVAAGAGLWQFHVSVLLPVDGPREIIFRASDEAGNASAASVRVVRDLTPPRLTVLAPSIVNAPSATISGTVDDHSVSRLQFQLDGGTIGFVPVVNGAWTFQITPGSVGDHALDVLVRDSLGNSATESRVVRFSGKDQVAPVLQLIEPARNPDTAYTDSRPIHFKAVDGNLAQVWLGSEALPATPTNEWTRTVSLHPGGNEFQISAVDSAGNPASLTVQIVRIDTVAPVFLSWSHSDTVRSDTLVQVFHAVTSEPVRAQVEILPAGWIQVPFAAVLYAPGDTAFHTPLDTVSLDSLDRLDSLGLVDSLTPIKILTQASMSVDTLILDSSEVSEFLLRESVLPDGIRLKWRWHGQDEAGNWGATPWDTFTLQSAPPKLNILSGPANGDTLREPQASWSLVGYDDRPGAALSMDGQILVVDSVLNRGLQAGSSRFATYAHVSRNLRAGWNDVLFRATDAGGQTDSLHLRIYLDTTSKPGNDDVVYDPIGDGTGIVDFGEVHVAHAADSLFFLIHLAGNPPPAFTGANNWLYVDLDGNTHTGDAHGFDARWKIESLGQNDDGTGSWMQWEIWRNGFWNYVGGNASYPQPNPFVTFAFNFRDDSWTPSISGVGDQILPSGRIAVADGGALELAIHVAHLDSIRWYLDGQGDAVGSATAPFIYHARNMRHITVDGRTADWGAPPERIQKSVQAITRTTTGQLFNQLRVELSLLNTGTVSLTGLRARYWFSVAEVPGAVPLLQGPYYAPYGETIRLVRANTLSGMSRLSSDIWVAEINWPGKTLGAGNLTQDATGNAVSFDIYLPNWVSWNRSNDWSRDSTAAWTTNDHVTVESDGVQLWGLSPVPPPAHGPNLAPIAVITGPSAGQVGQKLFFSGDSSQDPDNGPAPLGFRWVLVETGGLLSTTSACTTSFAFAGTWHVRLDVDDGDLGSSATQTIQISGTPPVVLTTAPKILQLTPGSTTLKIPASALSAIGWSYSQIRLQIGAQDGRPLQAHLTWPGGAADPSGWSWVIGLGSLPKDQDFLATLTVPDARTVQIQWWAE